MHIELTEMLRCPQAHEQAHLVLSTGEMVGRMVRSGILGCPACQREYPILDGIVEFGNQATGTAVASAPTQVPNYSDTLQALLDLSGPGGIVALVGQAARYAADLATRMEGIHFVGTNAPSDCEELPMLSLLRSDRVIPLRDSTVRGVLIGADLAGDPWLDEAHRVLLRGRRWVVEGSAVAAPAGVTRLASGEGLVVGEKR